MRVAESILFAGKAVRVLRNPSPSFRLKESFVHNPNVKGSHRVQGFLGNFATLKELPDSSNLITEDLLPQSEADKINAMLLELKVILFENFLLFFSIFSRN